MPKQEKMPRIFEYFDYREYLQDTFAAFRKRRIGYSYRVFSSEAGISSHNFLPRIIRRERNLSQNFIAPVARYLKLSAEEVAYLNAMVAFNNSKTLFLKEQHLKELLALHMISDEHQIDDEKPGFYEKLSCPVVRETAAPVDSAGNTAAPADCCTPRISPSQASGAIRLLVANGFLEKGADGRLVSRIATLD